MAMNAMNSVTHGLTAGVQMTQIVMVASVSVTRDSVCRTAQLWCSQWTAGLYTHINETLSSCRSMIRSSLHTHSGLFRMKPVECVKTVTRSVYISNYDHNVYACTTLGPRELCCLSKLLPLGVCVLKSVRLGHGSIMCPRSVFPAVCPVPGGVQVLCHMSTSRMAVWSVTESK